MHSRISQFLDSLVCICETKLACAAGAFLLVFFNLFNKSIFAAFLLASIWFLLVLALRKTNVKPWKLLLGAVVLAVGMSIFWPSIRKEVDHSDLKQEQTHALGGYFLPSPEDIKNAGDRAAGCFNEYGGDRASYSRLLKWKDTIKDPYLKELISTEIGRVEKAYPVDILRSHIDRWRYIWKPHVNGTKGFEDSTNFEANSMIAHLTRDTWQERARAACILRNIKTASDKGSVDKRYFYEKLVGLMGEKEKSLCVSKMAFETYKDLTGFRSEGTFDFEGAIKDWQRRQEEILKIDF